jgi:hypothetical protein
MVKSQSSEAGCPPGVAPQQWNLTNQLVCPGFHPLRGTQHHHPVLNPTRLHGFRVLDDSVRIHQYYNLGATWSHGLRNFHLNQRRANTHCHAAYRPNSDHGNVLYPRWPRFSSVGIHSDTNPAWRDVHKLCHIILHSLQTVQADSHDYIDTLVARRYIHELPHGSWIQQLRRPHFYHHTHNFRAYDRAHSPRRSNNLDRVPDDHTSRPDSHRTRRQAHTYGIRHITWLDRDQHHQSPRRKQHNHKHRDHDLLRDRVKLQRHAPRARLSAP